MSATDRKHLGKYDIVAEIGRGAHATVHKARDTTLDRIVALKVMRPGLLWEPDTVERFLREARAAARLEHPHIVTIYEVGEEEGTYYIAMRYLDGTTVEELIAQGPVPVERAVDIASQIAEALGHGHERGFIHRDVKPSNIIVDDDDVATLTDFGLVKGLAWASLTSSGGAMGTPSYVAPEIWEERGASPATDVYALGVVLWEMLAGQRLFEGETPAGVMRKHLTVTPPPLTEVRPDVPPTVAEMVTKALKKVPEDRYQDGNTVVQALREAIEEPVEATLQALIDLAQEMETQGNVEGALEAYRRTQAAAPEGGKPAEELARTIRDLEQKRKVEVGLQKTAQPARSLREVAEAPKRRRSVSVVLPILLLVFLGCVVTVWLFTSRTIGNWEVVPARQPPPTQTAALTTTKLTEMPELTAITAGNVTQITLLRSLVGAHASVNSLAFSPDSSHLASGGGLGDFMVRLWRMPGGALEWTDRMRPYDVRDIAFSPDGTHLALVRAAWSESASGGFSMGSSGSGEVVEIRDASSGSLLQRKEEANGDSLSFNPRSSSLAFFGSSTVQVWDVPGDVETLLPDASCGGGLTHSPQGDMLAAGGCDTYGVKIWSIPDGTLLRDLNTDPYWIRDVSFSPDGSLLVAAAGKGEKTEGGASCCSQGVILIWKISDGVLWRTLVAGDSSSVNSVNFSPNGEIIASASSDNVVRLWSADDGTLLRTLEEGCTSVTTVSFSPDGLVLASGDGDGTVRLWGIAESVVPLILLPPQPLPTDIEAWPTETIGTSCTGIVTKTMNKGLQCSRQVPVEHGRYVLAVFGEPAAQAGIEVGDVIAKVNDQDIKGDELNTAIDNADIGDVLNLEVYRGKRLLEIEAEIGRRTHPLGCELE